MTGFDETRLDDESVLAAADGALRGLAESGARLRRAVVDVAEDAAVGLELAAELDRPRAVLLAGPETDLVRAVLAPRVGVPVVSWTAAELPGWIGGLDLVVLLAPAGAPDAAVAAQAATAVRRGCRLLVVCAPTSPVAEHAAGRWSTVLRTTAGEPVGLALLALHQLGRSGLGPPVDPDRVADAYDAAAVACTPHRDLDANPAKRAALALADSVPLVACHTPSDLGGWAADRSAAALRRITGLPVLAGDHDALMPVLEAAPVRSVFDDPYAPEPAGPGAPPRPSLLLLGGDERADADGAVPGTATHGERLRELAQSRGAPVVDLEAVEGSAPPVARVADIVRASWTATYLRLGLAVRG